MNKIAKILGGLVLILISSAHLSNVNAQAEPLASLGSYWNYWIGTEHAYGFHKYIVVKDTVHTATVHGTQEQKTVKASWIEKYSFMTFNTSADQPLMDEVSIFAAEGTYLGGFISYREGNASYVLHKDRNEWFKWIDMDAEPGDIWLVPEIVAGKGIYDYVEVSFVTTLEIDGKELPYLYIMPSCTSRYSDARDFTSRLRMSGYANLDYWMLHESPQPQPNGLMYKDNGVRPEELNYGLICAKVNGEYLATSQLEEYVRDNNPNEYEQEIIDCDQLKAPYRASGQSTTGRRLYNGPVHAPENNYILDFQKQIIDDINIAKVNNNNTAVQQNAFNLDADEIIKVPVVVHIVHNPSTPEERITAQQVDKMIEALNEAYSETRPDQVRDVFKSVIGNPHIQFVLADEDPQGNATDGIVYHETNEDYYHLPTTSDITERYAFKFNADKTGRNWDHTKYANIYVVDLGGMEGITNIGGFVTNPEENDNSVDYRNWIAEGNPKFWDEWLKSEEAALLDGLTVDTWYTFGGASENNPNATFATAIHELGHYFGLRHISLTLVQRANSPIEKFDDGFTDTPFTHYNQYKYVPCGQDVKQCGNLVQVENYMDYALDCACMFTVQQSAFMRNFIQAVRPNFVEGQGGTDIKDIQGDEILVYPNPARDYIHIEGEFKNARIMDATGRLVMTVPANQNTVYLNNFNPGIYFVMTELENGKNIINKIIIEVVK